MQNRGCVIHCMTSEADKWVEITCSGFEKVAFVRCHVLQNPRLVLESF